MTRSIPHRELRNDSARILREVAAGESFEITNHGEVVAVLVPPQPSSTPPLPVEPGRSRGGFGDLPRVRSGLTTGRVLDELRSDEG